MKNFFLLLFATQFFFSFATKEIDEVMPFVGPSSIVSDTFDAKVPKGKCLIEGTIYDYSTGEKLSGVTVLSGTRTKQSDKMGYFRVTQLLSVTHLKFSKKFYYDSYLEEYTFKNQHRIVVRIYMKNQSDDHQYEVKKPVIYAYSNQETNFKLSLQSKGELVFTYPSLSDEKTWHMQLKNDVLKDTETGQIFPYLFWESKQQDLTFQTTPEGKFIGNVVAKNEVLDYLESSLDLLGFNNREKTDFITFWAPQMQQFPYYSVQFLVDEECEQFATYEISPKPDALNRIYMLFAGQNSYTEPDQMQVLKPMKRAGFYLVDWGGVDITKPENLKAD